MRKSAVMFVMLAVFCLGSAINADCAASKALAAGSQEIQKSGSVVKTKYFELTIPEGWMMPQPAKQQPRDGVSAVFASEKGNIAVTINVMQASMPAEEIARQTAANMQKTGLKTTPPVEKNGMWVIDIEGKAKGNAWFGSDGKFCSVTTIFGTDVNEANKLLQAIKTGYSGLFPTSGI